jgi:glycerate 2-kinase
MRPASDQTLRLRDAMNTMPDATARSTRELLEALFRGAVAAAHPAGCLPPNLPQPPARGRLVILAAGKAAGSMTQVAEDRYAELPPTRLAGLAVTRHGYGRLWRAN